jgi:pimeloyl-ACP methyl ester carboxylesterase
MKRVITCVPFVLLAGVAAASASPASSGAAGPSPSTTSTLTVPSSFDGVPIKVYTAGAGDPALVLIHCWMCDHHMWDNVVPRLAKTYHVITLDLPGHGASGKNRKTWTMAAYGQDVQSVVEALHLGKVILVGHSMGGPVMLEAASRLQGRVVGMIAVDTLTNADAKPDPKVIQDWITRMRGDFRGQTEALVRAIAGKKADPAVVAGVVHKMTSGDPAIGIALMQELQHYDTKAGMLRAHAPIVAINSTMHPTNVAANRRYLPRYDLLPLPDGVGHFPQVEAPKAFNALLAKAIAMLTH